MRWVDWLVTMFYSAELEKETSLTDPVFDSTDHLSIYLLLDTTLSLSPSVAGFRLARLGAGSLSGIARPPPSRSPPAALGATPSKAIVVSASPLPMAYVYLCRILANQNGR